MIFQMTQSRAGCCAWFASLLDTIAALLSHAPARRARAGLSPVEAGLLRENARRSREHHAYIYKSYLPLVYMDAGEVVLFHGSGGYPILAWVDGMRAASRRVAVRREARVLLCGGSLYDSLLEGSSRCVQSTCA